MISKALLLAQAGVSNNIPGYSTDVISGYVIGGGGVFRVGSSIMFQNFFNLFAPNNTAVSLSKLITALLPVFITLSGIIFFVKILIGGFSYMTSAGDQVKVQAATKDITNSLIGLIVVIAAFFIIEIVQVAFGINIF
jgi:hypothetical protein